MKESWLECAPVLSDGFLVKEKNYFFNTLRIC
jgi:hypothetical protein